MLLKRSLYACAVALALSAASAFATAPMYQTSVNFTGVNGTVGSETKPLTFPNDGVKCLASFKNVDVTPYCALVGGGLSWSGDTLVSFGGAYADLTGKPMLFSGDYNDLANRPSMFSGAYADLTGKPSLFSGAYADLTGRPTLFSGSYLDLTGKPALAAVATSGAYADLTGKPTIPAAQVNADWTAVSGVTQILNKPSIPGAVTAGSPTSRSLSLATAYQCTATSTPCVVTIALTSSATLTLTGGTTTVGELRIGSANTVATGASGSAVGSYRNSLTGTLTIGLNLASASDGTMTAVVPAGWYFAVRQTSGTGLSIVSAFDQVLSS